MIKLGKLTDYAVTVLGEIARMNGGTASAHTLAGKTGLPEPTVAKELKACAQGGMIVSQRGVNGGYSLAKDAFEISIADIIVAMEGPIAIVSCAEGSHDQCRVDATCCMKGRWEKVNKAIKNALEDVNLGDMTGDARIVGFVEMKQA